MKNGISLLKFKEKSSFTFIINKICISYNTFYITIKKQHLLHHVCIFNFVLKRENFRNETKTNICYNYY